MATKTLEKEFKFFTDNHNELFKDYPDKYIVIQSETVVLAADSFEEALNAAIEKGLQVGEFLVQQCTEGESGFTQIFHSRAIF